MSTIRSQDGTAIAFDRDGAGPPLVLVGGAFSYRRYKGFIQLADLLAPRFTVVNYDRRGRGDSGDAARYAVEREIEDLDAIVRAVGGSASVFGMSSGGVLALRAAAAGVRIERLAIYQPPFVLDAGGHLPPPDFAERLSALVAADRRSRAVAYFMREGMGAPAAFVGLLRVARPIWSSLKAVAHTLPHDLAVMGETVTGRPLAREPWASIEAPTLIVDGGKSPPSLHSAADALHAVMPDSHRRTLDGQGPNVSMKALAPVLGAFLSRDRVPA